MFIASLAILLSCLSMVIDARVIWVPEEFSPDTGPTLPRRQTQGTCPTDSNLKQCPSDFPPDFCCSLGTTCLHINIDDTSTTAAICCPNGSDCNRINPVSCDQAKQDARQIPNSQLHSTPPQALSTCSTGCCPMGFSCENDQCVAQVSLSKGGGSTQPISPSPNSPSSTQSTTTPDTGSKVDPSANNSGGFIAAHSTESPFNGTSFLAGLIPGLAIGCILVALVFFCCIRNRRRDRDSHRGDRRREWGEKSRDTLTDLSTLQSARPTMHGRSISEPTYDPSATGVTRTDFLRGSPTRSDDANDMAENTYLARMINPGAPPQSKTPKIKQLFSRSPQINQEPTTPPMTQRPMPAHTKRSSLSFQISPIRALKKQKSHQSLRRQMNEDGSDSTETIQVLMSPDDEPAYKAERSGPARPSQSKQVPYASSSRYPSELQPAGVPFRIAAPPPVPRHQTNDAGRPSFLDSPYTPTKTQSRGAGGSELAVPYAAHSRRDTTFSTLMEKAGLRKSELVMGNKKRADAKYGNR